MKYGVKTWNNLKGWYEVCFFNTKKAAESFYSYLKNEWDGISDTAWIPDDIISSEDELTRKAEIFLNYAVKNYPLVVNTNGYVHTEYHNVRIINNDDPVDV